jgi:hypothetical protein
MIPRSINRPTGPILNGYSSNNITAANMANGVTTDFSCFSSMPKSLVVVVG